MVMEKLNKHVEEMRAIAKQMVPWTFPKVNFRDEQQILFLKQRTIELDGYSINILYSEADYTDHGGYESWSVQIQSPTSPFLPFNMVCKVGRAFLGTKNISYIEFYRNNRKVYCWTVKVVNGDFIHPGKQSSQGSFEGFDFLILHPGSVNLY